MDWAEIHHILTSRYAADGRYPYRWNEVRPARRRDGRTAHGRDHQPAAHPPRRGALQRRRSGRRARRACTGLTERWHDSRSGCSPSGCAPRSQPTCCTRPPGGGPRSQQRSCPQRSAWQSTSSRDSAARDHGEADGRRGTRSRPAFGGPPQSDPDRPYAAGSETWNQYLTRAGGALRGLIERHQGQRILIAGHGETTDAAATLLLRLPPGSCTCVGFQTDHAAITRWHMQRNRLGQELWILAAHNDTRHLASAP